MALSSKKKRRAFRNPKRVRRGTSNGFNAAVAGIVILGSVLVLVSRHPGSAGAVGPKLHNSANANNAADHWHAAFGVNICGKWQPGPLWPHFASDGTTRTRADNQQVYAGLHTHELANGQSDGVIHMEPSTTDESGRNATVGKWMEYGGWKLSKTSMSLWPGADGKPIKEKNGDKCANKVGELRWATGEFKEGKTTKLTERTGNPSDYKLYDQNVIAVYFEPKGANLDKLGKVPSEANLPTATQVESNSASTTTMAGRVSTTVPGATTTTVKGATSTTVAGSATTVPGSGTTTPTTTAVTTTSKP